jgi:chromosome segregation ATPase
LKITDGVFLGALLAILNQLFVIRIERLASSTVLETIEGTDPAMLGAAGSIFAPITAELDAFVDKLGQSGAMLGDLTTRVHEAGALLTTAAGGHYAEVNKSAKDFRDKVKTLASVVTATKDHLTTYLSETSSSVNEVRATLSESLAVTRSMAERSADSLSEHGRQLESSAARIAEATKTGLDRVFAAHAATIQDRVERGRSSLDDVHGKLALAMQPISDLVATIEGLRLALQQTIDSQRNDAGSRATLEAALQTQATAGREMADKIDRLSRMIGAAALKLSESEGRVTQQLRETVLALRTQPPTTSVPLSPTATSTPASHVPPVQAGRPT